jgi:hypothetical protein
MACHQRETASRRIAASNCRGAPPWSVREQQPTMHQVMVTITDDGFIWNGGTLVAFARSITGTKWNGAGHAFSDWGRGLNQVQRPAL